MKVGTVASRFALALIVAGTAAALSGCSSIRDAMGAGKAPPDEFTVMTAAPLIVPPDYNLRPPQPGAVARTAQDPAAQARAALYSGTPEAAAAALPTSYSESEKMLLARSGASTIDPAIRQTISTETGYEVSEPTVTDRVLSGQSAPAVSPPATPAPAEAAPATPGQ